MDKTQAFNIALSVVPTYDGNTNSLYRFITAAEGFANQFLIVDDPENYQNQIVFNGLFGKLQGKALEVSNISVATSWASLKETLVQNFSDQRDENSLNRDLVNLCQGNESPQHFYDRCLSVLNTITNYINLHNNDISIRSSKITFYNTQTLKTFLAGLKEPLGSTIRAMRPDTLPLALQYIKEEMNIEYIQRRNNASYSQERFANQRTNFNQNFKRPLSAPRNYSTYGPRPFQNGQQTFVPSWQQKFNDPKKQNTESQPNFFNQPPKRTYPKPVPMSGVSYARTNNNNANNAPRFVPLVNRPVTGFNQTNPFSNVGYYPDYAFEELNMNEADNYEPNCDESYPQYAHENTDVDNQEYNQDFQKTGRSEDLT